MTVLRTYMCYYTQFMYVLVYVSTYLVSNTYSMLYLKHYFSLSFFMVLVAHSISFKVEAAWLERVESPNI